MAQSSSLTIPFNCFIIIFINTFSKVIAFSKFELSTIYALICCFIKPFERFSIILLNSKSF